MSGSVDASADARSKTIGQNFRCRAWVNFNGTGTVAIRGSGNVSSITDNGTGNYMAVFTSALPDGNYAVGGLQEPTVSNAGSDTFPSTGNSNANQVGVVHFEDGTVRDSSWVNIIVMK